MQMERAEAFFPLRVTTTAADSKRDARAVHKGTVCGVGLSDYPLIEGGVSHFQPC
jgi:hypothetical protein